MNRLKNSSQEHNQLVRNLGTNYKNANLQPRSNNFDQRKDYNIPQNYYSNHEKSLNNQNQVGRFVIPKIRYRHIQDQKKN